MHEVEEDKKLATHQKNITYTHSFDYKVTLQILTIGKKKAPNHHQQTPTGQVTLPKGFKWIKCG